jgi:membrane protease subunit HflC
MFRDLISLQDGVNTRNVVKAVVAIVITLILLGLLSSNIFQVRDNQYVVIRQFGEVTRIIDKPGYNFKIPFLQSREVIARSIQMEAIPQALINTADKKPMLIDSYALYKVVDPKEMIQNMRSISNAQSRMGDQIYSLIRSELGTLNYDKIISSEEAIGRSSLTDGILKKVNAYLETNNAGIELIDVRLKRTDLPTENEQSVYNRMISERQSKAQEYLSMGDAENNRITASTNREVKEMLAEAKEKAETIRGEGEGQAAKIYNQSYSQDPTFYELYRTLESYKKTINEETVILLPADSKYAKILTGK